MAIEDTLSNRLFAMEDALYITPLAIAGFIAYSHLYFQVADYFTPLKPKDGIEALILAAEFTIAGAITSVGILSRIKGFFRKETEETSEKNKPNLVELIPIYGFYRLHKKYSAEKYRESSNHSKSEIKKAMFQGAYHVPATFLPITFTLYRLINSHWS